MNCLCERKVSHKMAVCSSSALWCTEIFFSWLLQGQDGRLTLKMESWPPPTPRVPSQLSKGVCWCSQVWGGGKLGRDKCKSVLDSDKLIHHYLLGPGKWRIHSLISISGGEHVIISGYQLVEKGKIASLGSSLSFWKSSIVNRII